MNQIREEPRHSNCRSSLSFSLSCFLEKKKEEERRPRARRRRRCARVEAAARARSHGDSNSSARRGTDVVVCCCCCSMLLILDAQFFFVSSSFNGNLPNQFLPTTKPKKGRHKGHGQKVLSFALRRHKVLPPNPPFVFFFSFFFFRTPRTTTTVVSCVVSDTFWTLVARDDALSFSLSLLGFPFSLARAQKARRTYARAL